MHRAGGELPGDLIGRIGQRLEQRQPGGGFQLREEPLGQGSTLGVRPFRRDGELVS